MLIHWSRLTGQEEAKRGTERHGRFKAASEVYQRDWEGQGPRWQRPSDFRQAQKYCDEDPYRSHAHTHPHTRTHTPTHTAQLAHTASDDSRMWVDCQRSQNDQDSPALWNLPWDVHLPWSCSKSETDAKAPQFRLLPVCLRLRPVFMTITTGYDHIHSYLCYTLYSVTNSGAACMDQLSVRLSQPDWSVYWGWGGSGSAPD